MLLFSTIVRYSAVLEGENEIMLLLLLKSLPYNYEISLTSDMEIKIKSSDTLS